MARTGQASSQYVQHRPEQTLLFEVVRDNLVPFLQHTKSIYKNGIPRYVEKELREYLKCVIRAHLCAGDFSLAARQGNVVGPC